MNLRWVSVVSAEQRERRRERSGKRGEKRRNLSFLLASPRLRSTSHWLLLVLTRSLCTGFINEDGTPGDRFKFKSLPQGAATHIVAAFERSLKGGEYLDDCQVQKECEEYALNEENAEKLWKVSNELTKSHF